MTSVAITGHRGLAADTLALVDRALRWEAALRIRPGESELIGVSCLADGPDSLFAQAVLDAGGRLIAVVPARRYRASLPAEHHAVYDRLLAAAARVIELDREHSDPEAHQAGSLRMLDEAAELLAVWDEQARARLRRHRRCGVHRAGTWDAGHGALAGRGRTTVTGSRTRLEAGKT